MTSPGARYSAGTAFLDVVPSFRGVQQAIKQQVREMEKALGKDAGDEFGKQFEQRATKAVDKALGTTKENAKKNGKEAGDEYAGQFASRFSSTMTQMHRELKPLKLDAQFDDKKLQNQFNALRRDIEDLSKRKIGIDIEAGPAMIEMDRLDAKLRSMRDVSIDLEVRDNLGAAIAKVDAFRKDVQRNADLTVEVEIKYEKQLGLFERAVKQRIDAALHNFPPIEFDADVTPAENRLMRIRQQLKQLQNEEIGVDIDSSEALAEMERLRRELAALATDESIDVKVRTDAAGAAAELLAVRTLAELVDKTKVDIEVKVDVDKGFGALARLQAQLKRVQGSGDSGANSLRTFNAVILAGATLIPAVVPALGALAGGLALLGPLAIGAGAGIATMIFGFGGIGDAVKALGKARDNAAKDAEASAKRMKAASRSVEDAQRSVTRAEESGARAVATANRQVVDAREAAAQGASDAADRVKDTARETAQANEDAARRVSDAQRESADATEQSAERVEDAMRNAARANESAAKSVTKAQERVAEAGKEATDKVATAVDNQREAEDNLVDTQADVVRAQQKVTQAREDAIDRLEDLRYSLEGGSLAEKRAVLSLADAQRRYTAAINDPGATVRERTDLLMSLQEEDLNLRQIRTSNERLAEQQAEANRTGVEGSKEVTDAQQGVVDAQDAAAKAQKRVQDAAAATTDAVTAGQKSQKDAADDLADAVETQDRTREDSARNVADAVEAQQKQQLDSARSVSDAVAAQVRTQADSARSIADAAEAQDRQRVASERTVADAVASAQQAQLDSAQSISDAQRNLAEAQADYTTALGETSASAQAVEVAMGKLGPAGQQFAQFIADLSPKLREMRDLVQAGMFPGLEDAITRIVTASGPALSDFLERMGKTLGDMFSKFGQLMTGSEWQAIWATVSQYAPIFMTQFADVGMAILTFFGELFRGLAPYSKTFGDSLVVLADATARWMGAFVDSKTFRDIMDWLFTNGPVIFGQLWEIVKAIGSLFVALEPLGALVLAALGGIAKFINAMDPNLLGFIVTLMLGLVVAFQLAAGAIGLATVAATIIMNPFALVVFAIAAVVAGLIALYTQSETFRAVVDTIFHAIGAVVGWLFDNVIKPYFEYGIAVWTLLFNIFQWGWEHVLAPVFDAFGAVVKFLFNDVLGPIFSAIGSAFGLLGDGIAWVWTHILKPVFDVFEEILKWILIVATVLVLGPLLLAFQVTFAAIKLVWDNVLKPTLDFLWSLLKDGWEQYGKPALDALGDAWAVLSSIIKNAWDLTMKPVLDAFGIAISALSDVFRLSVDAIGVAWDMIKEKTRGPINWVIDTVLNKGLLTAFNAIVSALHLPGDWIIQPLGLIDAPTASTGPSSSGQGGRNIAMAAGGVVPGWSPNDVADNIDARLTAGEHVQPRKRVRQYGMDLFEAFRHGEIDPRAARSLMKRPGYAEGGPVYQQVFSAVKKRFPNANLNDGFRPGAHDLHGQGLAVDLGEAGFAGGDGRPYLAAMNRDLFDRAGKYIAELIYDGQGDDRPDLKNGNPLNYGAKLAGEHHNHVHLGVRDLAGFLGAYGAGDGGGILGAAGDLLGGAWDSVTSVLGSLKDAVSKPLAGLANQFGDSKLGQLAGGVVNSLPDRMWDKLKDSVTGKAAELWNGAGDLASAGISAGKGAFSWAIDKITGGSVQDTVRSAAAQRGWGDGAEWDALSWVVGKESGWNPKAQNPSSTASGLFQQINATWMANRPAGATALRMADAPVDQQAVAGMNYFAERYGNPTAAKRYWEANGHYAEGGPVMAPETPTLFDTGGWLPPGITTVLNATNKPEPVLTGKAWDDLVDGRSSTDAPHGPRIDKVEFNGVDFNQAGELWAEFNHGLRTLEAGGKYREDRVSG